MILQQTIVVVDYTFELSFSNHALHFEGEEVFKSTKQTTNYPLGADNDSHWLDQVSFSHPWVIIHVVQPNIVQDVGM